MGKAVVNHRSSNTRFTAHQEMMHMTIYHPQTVMNIAHDAAKSSTVCLYPLKSAARSQLFDKLGKVVYEMQLFPLMP
ncbi:hypothetical protein ACE6H2_002383 [Prunus campanulata]